MSLTFVCQFRNVYNKGGTFSGKRNLFLIFKQIISDHIL